MGKPYDILLWGCTGFTGQLVSVVLARRYGLRCPTLRICLGGRSKNKINDIAHDMLHAALLQPHHSDIYTTALAIQTMHDTQPTEVQILPILSFSDWGKNKDETDKFATYLCSQTHVIISLAGPFSEYAEPLIKACSETGTDYVDITGEYFWVASMRDKYHHIAFQNKSRIIPCCGFDYILNDLGVFALQTYGKTVQDSNPLSEILQVCKVKGSIPSQGTIQTMLKAFGEMPLLEIITGRLFGPYAMCKFIPDKETQKLNRDLPMMYYSALAKSWISPNIMGRGMKRYIHWVNEIQNFVYGKKFVYLVGDESSGFITSLMKAISSIITLSFSILLSRLGFSRLPNIWGKPKQPTISELEATGHLVQLKTLGIARPSKDGSPVKLQHTITFNKGEAYLMTANTVLEAAVACLKLRTTKKQDEPFGFGSPSQMLGSTIESQLRSAGFLFELTEVPA